MSARRAAIVRLQAVAQALVAAGDLRAARVLHRAIGETPRGAGIASAAHALGIARRHLVALRAQHGGGGAELRRPRRAIGALQNEAGPRGLRRCSTGVASSPDG